MQVQQSQLPADVEYFLDSALEHTELDVASHYALKLYGGRPKLMSIVDHEWELGPGTRCGRQATCDALIAYADDIIAEIDADKRAAILLAGMLNLKHQITESANFMAWWAIEDMLIGGCSKPYIRNLTKWGHLYTPSPKHKRRLYGADWIRRYVKMNISNCGNVVSDSRRFTRRCAGVDMSRFRDAADVIEQEVKAQHEAYLRTNAAMTRAWLSNMTAQKKDRREKRKNRKVIRRAATCAETVIGSDAVRAFGHGKPVLLVGEKVSLEVSRYGSAGAMGHGAVHVAVIDPNSKRRLANLCIYQDRTPALDQLTSLALGMSSGEEKDIIESGNLYNITELGYSNEMIAEKGGLREEARQRPLDLRKRTNEAYWLDTKDMWIDSVGVRVMGRLWGRV